MLLMKPLIPSSCLISFTQTPFKIVLWLAFKIVFSRVNMVLETKRQVCKPVFRFLLQSFCWQPCPTDRHIGSTLNKCSSSTCKIRRLQDN